MGSRKRGRRGLKGSRVFRTAKEEQADGKVICDTALGRARSWRGSFRMLCCAFATVLGSWTAAACDEGTSAPPSPPVSPPAQIDAGDLAACLELGHADTWAQDVYSFPFHRHALTAGYRANTPGLRHAIEKVWYPVNGRVQLSKDLEKAEALCEAMGIPTRVESATPTPQDATACGRMRRLVGRNLGGDHPSNDVLLAARRVADDSELYDLIDHAYWMRINRKATRYLNQSLEWCDARGI